MPPDLERIKRIEDRLRGEVICACGATLTSFVAVCGADLDQECEGFKAIEEAGNVSVPGEDIPVPGA